MALSDGSVDAIRITSYVDETQLPAIMALMAMELSEPYSIFTYRLFLHGWPELCFLAHSGDELVGAVVGKADMKRGKLRGYIAMLAVHPGFRKHGLGLKLAATLVQKMTETCDEIVLETELTNTAALRLYDKLGFIRDKRLPRYYMNGNDAYRLKAWAK